jgi:indolepyruvate ferredoxin oxidoreductase alpha subunit
MTGGQPVPHLGFSALGQPTKAIAIEPLVRAAGVDFLEVCDPYDSSAFQQALQQADRHIRSDQGSVAVVISRRPCLMTPGAKKNRKSGVMSISDDCGGCGLCVSEYECPALSLDGDSGMAVIDQDRCVGCGTCVDVCPVQAIGIEEE